MLADTSFFQFQGGIRSNSLCDMYYDMDMLKLFTEQNNGCFSILSSNVESINAKMNEIEAFVEELSQMHFKFSLICFQESALR